MKMFTVVIVSMSLYIQCTNADMSVDANSVHADANKIDVKKVVTQTLAAMDKVASYQSRLMAFDFTKDALQSKDFISIEWRFEYEVPNKYAVDQMSWEENVADRWISIGKKQYVQIGSWFEDTSCDRTQMNDFLTFSKFRPILKKSKFTFSGTEEIAGRKCIMLKGTLDNSTKLVFHQPEGKISNEVIFSVEEGTLHVAKVSVRFRGTDEAGKKIDSELRQLFQNYDKPFNIVKPSDIAG